MGWTYTRKPRGAKNADFIRNDAFSAAERERIVAMSASLEAVFVVYRIPDYKGDVYVTDPDGSARGIVIFKTNNVRNPADGYNFGWKDMDESMGPYGCEAPASIIAAASELKPLTDEERAKSFSGLKSAYEYRERSLAASKVKAAKRSLKVGAKVVLGEPLNFRGFSLKEFTVWRGKVRKGRYGSKTMTAFMASNGMLCDIPAAKLANATITEGT